MKGLRWSRTHQNLRSPLTLNGYTEMVSCSEKTLQCSPMADHFGSFLTEKLFPCLIHKSNGYGNGPTTLTQLFSRSWQNALNGN